MVVLLSANSGVFFFRISLSFAFWLLKPTTVISNFFSNAFETAKEKVFFSFSFILHILCECVCDSENMRAQKLFNKAQFYAFFPSSSVRKGHSHQVTICVYMLSREEIHFRHYPAVFFVPHHLYPLSYSPFFIHDERSRKWCKYWKKWVKIFENYYY